MSTNDPLPSVVYIAGYGRSGSTVLDVLLGNCSDVCAVGELFMFFRPDETERCCCGESIADCEFWTSVRAAYERRRGTLPDNAQGLSFRRCVESACACGCAGSRTGEETQGYAECQRALFSAIAEVSGATWILDSSKTAVEVARRPTKLRQAGVRVKTIHLVRDGRGCMWSTMRGCNRKLERGDANPQLRFPMLRSVVGWIQANFAAMLQPHCDCLRVRYSDLVRDPRRELARIGRFLEVDTSAVADRLEAGEVLPSGHSISGNRLRHTGVSHLQADEEWRQKLPTSGHVLYWLFAWPLHLLLLRRPFDHQVDSPTPHAAANG